jgi:hypothetical protein
MTADRPSLPSRVLQTLLPAVLGTLGGVWGASTFADTEGTETPTRAVSVRPIDAPPVFAAQPPPSDAGPGRALAPAEVVELPAPEVYDEPPSRLARESSIVRHERRLESHRQSPIDGRWSRVASTALWSDLDRLDDASLRTIDVECRSRTCAVRIEFESYDVAVARHAELVSLPLQLNCTRHIVVPPNDTPGPYEATMLIDCTEDDASELRW